MNLRFIERDGKKILQERKENIVVGQSDTWHDVPLIPNVDEEKTLAEKIGDYHEGYLKGSACKEIVSIVREHIGELYEDWKVHKGGMFQDVIRELK